MIEKAKLVAMKLDADGKRWKVEFALPSTVDTLRRITVSVDAKAENERGPDREKPFNEVATEAHKALCNALWPAMRAAINAMDEGAWERFMQIARADADDARLPPADA